MSEETIEKEVEEVEEDEEVDSDEPVYYNPKVLNLVATVSGIFSWVILIGFIALIVGQYLVLQELAQGQSLTELFANAQVKNWIYTNMALPLLNGLGFFFVLQAVSIGLNVLLEIDFNLREAKS